MKALLEKLIRTRVKSPKETEIQEILDIFKEKTFRKGDFFKTSNTISKELGFLTYGSVRVMIVKKNGDEITGRILEKDNFVVDLVSVRTGECTPANIVFLENSSMLVTPISSMQALLETNLTFNIFIREYMADKAVEMGKQHILFMNGTAKDRYRFMLENYPHLFQKFPLRFIASMIGITPTQLSRIRKEK